MTPASADSRREDQLMRLVLLCWLLLLPGVQAATVTINTNVKAGTSMLKLGGTQTQVYWERGNATAAASATNLLKAVLRVQNQSIMGWGAGPVLQTSSGAPIDFSGLDKRVGLMQALGGELALTLCTAPGWMKTSGQDWSMEDRVADDHVTDFATLCRAIAQRYPQVHYFDIWNEMKGYWNSSIRNSDGSYGNWDYVRYTTLYNAVYTAIKAVRPDAEVGGFYLPIYGDGSTSRGYAGPGTKPPWRAADLDGLNYWLANNVGADFIAMDRWLVSSQNTNVLSEADQLALTWTYKTVVQAIRAKTSLPIWYAEYYTADYNPAQVSQFIACTEASMYYWMIQGASNTPITALLWGPVQGAESAVSQVHGLVSSTTTSAGGKPSLHYSVFQWFHDYFGPGTQLYQATCADTNIEVLASLTKTLLINKYNSSQTVSVNNATYTLTNYEVRLIDTLPPMPPVPTGLTATPGGSQAALSWDPSSAATGYNLRRSTVSGGPYAVLASLTHTSYLDGGLTNGSTYYYVVSATNSTGESINSLQVSVTPAVPAPVLWYKADAITGVANNARLGAWNDASGNGNAATNGLSAQQPTFVTGAMNGLPIVRFAGASSNSLAFARPVQDDFTLVCVFQSAQGLGAGTLFWQGAGLISGEVNGPTNDFGLSLNATGQLLAGTGNPTPPDNTAVSGPGLANGAPHVCSFTRSRSSGALALYVDGVLAGSATGSSAALTAPNRLVLGAQQTLTNFFTGELAEVQIFNSALLTSDRQAAERALAIKYSIPGNYGSNVPPAIVWLAPTNNASFVQPKTMTLMAAASDLDGTVTKVDFFNGATLLGTATHPPFSLAWSNVAPGSYTLWGRVTDNTGATISSPPVSVAVQPLQLVVVPGPGGGAPFGLQFQAQNEQNYIVDTSTNLTTWMPMLTNMATNGRFLFIDTNATEPKRFYRVRQ